MSNNCYNKLEITCTVSDFMLNIMEMIFAQDEKGNPLYTMEKLLPIPAEFSKSTGYRDAEYYWCLSVWCTKWDVIGPRHKQDGSTLTLQYDTAWVPNIPWVKTLCEIIEANWDGRFLTPQTFQLNITFGGWE